MKAYHCVVVAVVVVVASGVHAEIGDDLWRDICDPRSPSSQCLPDRLEIAFEEQPHNPMLELDRFVPGQVVDAMVVLEVETEQVRGYSLGVAHDTSVLELDPDGDPFSFVGTPLEEVPNGFRNAQVVPGGLIMAGLPSFEPVDPVVLPPGRTVLLRMRYRLLSDPGLFGTRLAFSSELGDPVHSIVLTHDQLSFPEVGEGLSPGGEVACANGLDDDEDGAVDRDDPDCVSRNSVSGVPTTVIDGLIRTLESDGSFLRGDCNADGSVNIADGVALLRANFSGDAPLACRGACDANGDGGTGGTSDAIWIFAYRFGGGPPPVAPFPECEPLGGVECEQSSPPCR